MKGNRITKKLHIELDYVPNDSKSKKSYELIIKVNDKIVKINPQWIFAGKDWTMSELLQELKEQIEIELGI